MVGLELSSPKLGHSLEVAFERYGTVERKLGKDRELQVLFNAFMQEYLDLGHISKVADLQSLLSREGPNIYYLPHHSMIKQTSLVFDASCSTNNGVSLNSVLLNGPKLQDDIFDIGTSSLLL
ncbi:unnamed protein product [Ceutorhynchus assimilis]|uniref:Uncharacterized protein n=1 Tax=Ceutorhynchus assimilis TaxID=467358 RepID=A0A9N9N3I8_9CUCU|nr:unnamed protein product [Ceutorhynchus assimilis]